MRKKFNYMPFILNKLLIELRTYKSGKVNYWTGNGVNLKEFSNYIGNKYSVALSNGSVALEIALKVLNLKTQDEIIVTQDHFVISASCTINLGLKPVLQM